MNKWLLAATVAVVLSSAGLFFWANKPAAETSLAETAKDVNLDNTPFKEYLRTGRSTAETFYAITLPAWEQLPEEKQKEILQQTLDFATKNGQKNVQLVNVRGRNVAFASKNRIEILNPNP